MKLIPDSSVNSLKARRKLVFFRRKKERKAEESSKWNITYFDNKNHEKDGRRLSCGGFCDNGSRPAPWGGNFSMQANMLPALEIFLLNWPKHISTSVPWSVVLDLWTNHPKKVTLPRALKTIDRAGPLFRYCLQLKSFGSWGAGTWATWRSCPPGRPGAAPGTDEQQTELETLNNFCPSRFSQVRLDLYFLQTANLYRKSV